MANADIPWDDTSWIKVGTKIRWTGYESREKPGPDADWRTLATGTIGRVVEVNKGYPKHRCPDHGDEYCACGGDEAEDPGWIPEHAPWAVVEFPAVEKGLTVSKAIHPEGSDRWERVKS